MLFLDVKYLRQVSYRLERFKEKKNSGSEYLANCKCPICGDSEKKSTKTRGYFFNKENHLMYYCHNCGASLHFGQWLKTFDFPMWQEWKFDHLKINQEKNPPKKIERVEVDQSIVDNLLSMDFAPSSHRAKKYILERKIPHIFWSDIFYTSEFYKWTLGHTDKFENVPESEEHDRIIIPWRDETGRIFAYQARSLNPHPLKYYSIVLDKSVPRIFGLDRVDWNKTIYCVEGPIDSMFLDNCVAVGTSSLLMFQTDRQDVIYIPDAEPRNKEIVKIYEKIINAGKKIVIAPDTYKYKDINEAVLDNFDIKTMIDNNVYQGLTARLRFSEWRKIYE